MSYFKRIFFWTKNRIFRPEAQKSYHNAIEYELKSIEEKIDFDFKQRLSLVNYAYSHSPFYKKLYDSQGFDPTMLKTEEDWEKVPIIEKHMIRENTIDFISNEAKKRHLNISTTGGSTGKPLKLYKSKHVHYEVLAWRALRWWGINPFDNEAILHRRVPTSYVQKKLNRLLWWPTKRAYLSATAIDNHNLELFISDLKKYKIKWIVGYCGSIEYVADYILKNNIIVNGIDLVWSTSSPLTDIVRKKIERAFKCKVMDQYGCCEMGNIAVQRPNEDFLTVNSDYVHVDIVNEKNKIINNIKGFGDVLITDLKTKEFPLIKYRLGDKSKYIFTMKESIDGFPRIAYIKGRISDALWLPNDTYIDGAFLTTICDDYSEYISCYQIRQTLDYNINIDFIPKNNINLCNNAIQEIISKLRNKIGDKVDIKYNIVSEIPDFAGKRKFIISDISLSNIQKNESTNIHN